MKKLSRNEMKVVNGGLAAVAYQCCVYTETETGGFYRRCGLTVDDAEYLVGTGGADPNMPSYYECGGSTT